MEERRVLFVCTHNSGRSQMAEAFLKELGRGRFQAESAGLEPQEVNPLVIDVMKEEGFDLSKNKADSIFDFFKEGRLYDDVIYVCNKDTENKCPVFPGIRRSQNWPFPDPAALTGTEEAKREKARQIRDQIKARVESWIKEFG
jgi:arsenate reductase